VVDSTVLACERITADRLSKVMEISSKATMLASQFGTRTGPIPIRAMELIASEVRLNRMMAVASEISRNRACTSRNSTTANAMMICVTFRTPCELLADVISGVILSFPAFTGTRCVGGSWPGKSLNYYL